MQEWQRTDRILSSGAVGIYKTTGVPTLASKDVSCKFRLVGRDSEAFTGVL